LRVLRWIIDRCTGKAAARDTAIGHVPKPQDLDLQGLDVSPAAIEELLAVNPPLWQEEFAGIDKYLAEFGERVPPSLKTELKNAVQRVHSSQV
jgi:phosphoenolpyruvate carboxykinase (GTP)